MIRQNETIEVAPDERDALWALQHYMLGGSPRGPRKHVESLVSKLHDIERGRFMAVERVSKIDVEVCAEIVPNSQGRCDGNQTRA